MNQLKLKTSWLKRMESLSDVECGRLIRGMLTYASSGEVPELKGSERILWAGAMEEIDEQRDSHDRQQAANTRRRDEALRGVTGRDAASRGVEKAFSPTPPTTPCIPLTKERKKTPSKDGEKERQLSPALQDALKEFKDMRVRMRKPMVGNAVNRLLSRLNKLSKDEQTQIAILHRSVDKGWTDVYALQGDAPRKERNTLKNYQEQGVNHPELGEIELDLGEL